jgi:nucleoredoxin
MAGVTELLGASLLGKQGKAPTADHLSGKKCIALYFSAHWCPPCRGFTPKLAEWYKEHLSAKGLEVVFVSSDKDETAFEEYFGEMPWVALPFADRGRKEALSKKYKVNGIPSLVILDSDGQLITKDGRAAIAGDPTGENMPWKPRSLDEILASARLLGPGGSECAGSSLKGKVFGLYFSAHWCPPCRGFTPKLAEWYSKDLKGKGLEIVFVSSDQDEGAFKEYFKEQPWLALDFADRKAKEELSQRFGVSGIPSFVIIDADGSVMTKEGRSAVTSDPTGVEFPWYPKPVSNLAAGPGNINEIPTVMAFCETSDASAQKAIEEAMAPLAKKYREAAKAKGDDDPEVAFMVATSSEGLSGRLRGMLGMTALEESSGKVPPKLMLVDIPDNGGYFEGPEGEITQAAVEQFVANYEAKKLERKQLSS